MSETLDDPAALDESLEVALGRRAPYTQVGDWVLLSGTSSDARTLYWGLSAHINVTREDTEVWPGLRTLARILQLKKPEHVARYMLELEVIGAIEVVRSVTGLKRRNRYVVHQLPPRGYVGPQSMAEWYASNRPQVAPGEEESQAERELRESEFDRWLDAVRAALKEQCELVSQARVAARKAKLPVPAVPMFRAPAIELFRTPEKRGTQPPAGSTPQRANSTKTAGQDVPPFTGVRTPVNGGLVPPSMGVEQDQEEQDKRTAPSGRVSAPDARRAPTGSGARARRGGSAASGKTGISIARREGRQPVRMSKEQAAAIRMVEASFPQALVALLPKYRPPVLRDAIVDALGDRTPAQLVERVSRRWIAHGYAEAAFGGKGIGSAVGVAVALLRAPVDCPDQSCEDGMIVGSGALCVACKMRKTDRRPPKAVELPEPEPHPEVALPIPGQTSPPPAKWWCVTGCGFSSYAVQPDDQMCRDCRADAQAEAALADPTELELVRQAVEAALVGEGRRR